jgi:hypothetical protein
VHKVDRGDRRGLERARVKDHEIGRVTHRVNDEPDEPALVFFGLGPRRHEHELARDAVGAELVHASLPRLQIVLVELRRTRELGVAVGRN